MFAFFTNDAVYFNEPTRYIHRAAVSGWKHPLIHIFVGRFSGNLVIICINNLEGNLTVVEIYLLHFSLQLGVNYKLKCPLKYKV